MSKLIIMRGLPASGKSTRAKEILEASGNAVRINKDLLRTMLHFDKFTGRNEEMTRNAARTLASLFLEDGKNVVIDDTNLNPGTLQSWKDLAKESDAKVQIEKVETPFEECLKRDFAREKQVGENVIYGMAMKAGLYPKPKKGIVLCDLDGTLANIEHRRHFVNKPGEPKDWKSFFEAIPNDELNEDVADQVLKLDLQGEGYEIFLVSARPEEYREITEIWLEKKFKGYKFYQTLFMRGSGDSREDTEIKKDMYTNYFMGQYIFKVFDDRPRVIKMWREFNLDVVDCGDGVDF